MPRPQLLLLLLMEWKGKLLMSLPNHRYSNPPSCFLNFSRRNRISIILMNSCFPCLQAKANLATLHSDRAPTTAEPSSRECDGDRVMRLCQEGRLTEALYIGKCIVQQNTKALPASSYVSLMKACARKKALAEGKLVHALMIQSRCDSSIFLANNLVDMYSKCGSVLDAQDVFTQMPRRNVFSWTAIISAYAASGKCEEAVNLFQQMQEASIAPDKVAFMVALKACARSGSLEQGKRLHFLIVKRGLEVDVILHSALIHMYAKCGCLDVARELFENMNGRDVVSWNGMMAGYVQKGLGNEALALYEQMKREGVQANKVTFIVVLKACASVAALELGREIHSLILNRGLGVDIIVQSTLVDMYAKCGCLENARQLFNKMRERNVVSWNSLIAGYAQNGLCKEALALYEQMKMAGLQADKITFIALLKACARAGALEQGKRIHSLMVNGGIEMDVILQSALLDMYAKCGCLEVAREFFDKMSERDVISWTAMIAGYAQNGLGKEALALYEQMKQEGLQPNKVTYLWVLSAFGHSGLVEEGRCVFDSMLEYGGVTPTLEHYACMVDLLGREFFPKRKMST